MYVGVVQGSLTSPRHVMAGENGWTTYKKWLLRLETRRPHSSTTLPVRGGWPLAANRAQNAGSFCVYHLLLLETAPVYFISHLFIPQNLVLGESVCSVGQAISVLVECTVCSLLLLGDN